jgi:DNA-binding transcriptional ArsR family regulator
MIDSGMMIRYFINHRNEGMPNMQSDIAVRALGALAQEHRLAAFRLLVQAGAAGMPAGQLADRLGVAPSSLSFHLAQLTNAGLIQQQRQGRSLIYSANYAAMGGLMAFLTENCCSGVAPCAPDNRCSPIEIAERNIA